MESRKRRSIGVMIGGVHSYFPREMIKGIIAKAQQEGDEMALRQAKADMYYYQNVAHPFTGIHVTK